METPLHPSETDLKLHPMDGIISAAVVGGILAGTAIVALNFKKTRNTDQLRNAILFGLLATSLFYAIVLLVLPNFVAEVEERYVSGGVRLAEIGVSYAGARVAQGKLLDEHASLSGAFYSSWRGIGVGFLTLFAVSAALIAVGWVPDAA